MVYLQLSHDQVAEMLPLVRQRLHQVSGRISHWYSKLSDCSTVLEAEEQRPSEYARYRHWCQVQSDLYDVLEILERGVQ